jgi:hypothetical protein
MTYGNYYVKPGQKQKKEHLIFGNGKDEGHCLGSIEEESADTVFLFGNI